MPLKFSASRYCLPVTLSVTLFVGGLLSINDAVRAAVPVEGERALLQLLLDAQTTNMARHEKGAFSGRITETGAEICDFQVEYVWNGDSRYIRYSGWSRTWNGGDRSDATNVELIVTPEYLMVHNPTASFAMRTRMESPNMGYQSALQVHPYEIWYTLGRFPVNWQQVFDWKKKSKGHMRITEGADETLIVESHSSEGRWLKITSSLAHGGNVVAYESDTDRLARGEYARRGRFQWTADGQGGWYATLVEHQQFDEDDPKSPFSTYRVEITNYDPNPVIPKGRFTLESFKLAAGTSVTDRDRMRNTSKRWAHGGPQKAGGVISTEALKALGENLREQGFADPARRKQ